MPRKLKVGDAVIVTNPRSTWDRKFIGETGKVKGPEERGYMVALKSGDIKFFQGRELGKLELQEASDTKREEKEMEELEDLILHKVLHKFTVFRGPDGLCHTILKKRGLYLARCAKDIEEALNFGIKPKNPIFVRGKWGKFRKMEMNEWSKPIGEENE